MCYMRIITHREMRNQSGEILRAVAAGETVQVSNHGRVAAVISPPNANVLARLVADGLARPARRPVVDLTAVKRTVPSTPSAEIVADSRGRW